MDKEVFKKALHNSLSRLPAEILQTIPALVVKHLPILEKVAPAIMADMMPQIGSAMTEMTLGVLDKDELMTAVKEVLSGFGINETPQVP